jgi:hypothetical protein
MKPKEEAAAPSVTYVVHIFFFPPKKTEKTKNETKTLRGLLYQQIHLQQLQHCIQLARAYDRDDLRLAQPQAPQSSCLQMRPQRCVPGGIGSQQQSLQVPQARKGIHDLLGICDRALSKI